MSRIRDQHLLEAQDQEVVEAMAKLFSKDQILAARAANTIEVIPNHLRRKLVKEAVAYAKREHLTPWPRSGSPAKGAGGSLRSFLMGYSRSLTYEVRLCFLAACSILTEGKVESAPSGDAVDIAFDLLIAGKWRDLAIFAAKQVKV